MAEVVLFASARQAAGIASQQIPGATVGTVLSAASALYGSHFADVLAISRVWINGEPVGKARLEPCCDTDEIAVLPPISGG